MYLAHESRSHSHLLEPLFRTAGMIRIDPCSKQTRLRETGDERSGLFKRIIEWIGCYCIYCRTKADVSTAEESRGRLWRFWTHALSHLTRSECEVRLSNNS